MARSTWTTVILLLLAWEVYEGESRRSLSDPLGLSSSFENNVNEFVGIGKNYVFGSVWPKPQSEIRGETLYSLNPTKFEFVSVGQKSDVLTAALARYVPFTFPDRNVHVDKNLAVVTTLEVNVHDQYAPLTLESDESYTLVINAPSASLVAATVWGALRGLETFSQVVYQNESGSYFVQNNKIVDFPRFHHRGFLIDTSRHYVAVPIIYQFLDALAFSKFNVFHWHIVDDQSFPFVSEKFPSLHGKGAWNNKTHIYTPTDIKNVIEYARLRGIRVMPEFDTPGHTQSWYSIPDLLTKCYSGTKPNGCQFCLSVDFLLYTLLDSTKHRKKAYRYLGPIDPTIDTNYVFLKSFFQEIASVFPDKYLHLGGDEVSFSCWQSNPKITQWMKEHGMAKNYSLLEQYYEQHLLDIVNSLGKGYVIWQEVVDNQVKVKPDTVVNVWKGGSGMDEMAKVTAAGHRAILSSCWYLNYISYGPDWPKYYKCDPQGFKGTQEQMDLVLGGTACMWGEWVDGTQLISRTWARGLSVGERLWSSKDTTDITDATKRIWEHRCRYLRRGIQAENVVQSEYCRHEWKNTK